MYLYGLTDLLVQYYIDWQDLESSFMICSLLVLPGCNLYSCHLCSINDESMKLSGASLLTITFDDNDSAMVVVIPRPFFPLSLLQFMTGYKFLPLSMHPGWARRELWMDRGCQTKHGEKTLCNATWHGKSSGSPSL